MPCVSNLVEVNAVRPDQGPTCCGVAGVAVPIAVARLAGAVEAELGPAPPVPRRTLTTVLPAVALRTRALLHPAGRSARSAAPCTHQRHVIEVTSTYKHTNTHKRFSLCHRLTFSTPNYFTV